MNNLAYQYSNDELAEELDFELIEGEKVVMAAAAPFVNHINIVSRLIVIFGKYIDEKNIEVRPDLSIVCDLTMVKNGKKVYGAPDLVVEVLSESTMDNDLGPKKLAYEECGVKEYWIVDQWSRRIEIYHLIDGKFAFSKTYRVSDDEEIKKDDTKNKIKVSIFDDLIVDVRDVFKWWINVT